MSEQGSYNPNPFRESQLLCMTISSSLPLFAHSSPAPSSTHTLLVCSAGCAHNPANQPKGRLGTTPLAQTLTATQQKNKNSKCMLAFCNHKPLHEAAEMFSLKPAKMQNRTNTFRNPNTDTIHYTTEEQKQPVCESVFFGLQNLCFPKIHSSVAGIN